MRLMRSRPQRLTKRLISCVIVVALCIGVVVVVRAIRLAGERERTLHAIICTANAIESFVQVNQRWPQDWHELSEGNNHHTGSMYRLPQDLPEVRRRVVVRFDVDDALLAHPRAARLLMPCGPCFEYEWRLDGMYRSLERTFPQRSNQDVDFMLEEESVKSVSSGISIAL